MVIRDALLEVEGKEASAEATMPEPTPAEYFDRARVFERTARHVVFEGADPVTQAAVLHLIAHSLELTLKGILLGAGRSTKDLKRSPYGHDLAYMWRLDEVSFLRRQVPGIAAQVSHDARESGRWVDNFADDPGELFLAQVPLLSKLHSADSDFALRYPGQDNPLVPRAPFLVDVIGPLVDAAREHTLAGRVS